MALCGGMQGAGGIPPTLPARNVGKYFGAAEYPFCAEHWF
jgi:hypothetical protein